MSLINKTLVTLTLSLLLTSCGWLADSTSSAYVSHQMQGEQLRINTQNGQISISGPSNHSIEVVYHQTESATFPSFAKQRDVETLKSEVVDEQDSITFTRGNLSAVLSKQNLAIKFYRGNEFLSEQTDYFSNRKHVTKAISETNPTEESLYLNGFSFSLAPNEKILGGGERILGMDRRGHRMPLYNRAHYGYKTESNQMNYSLPVIMSSKKYSILFDNSAKGFLDIGKTKPNELSFEAVGGRMAYIFFADESYPKLINEYVDVTGKQPLPPRWAFGNFSSRFGYTSQQEVLDTVNLFEQKDIPLDSIIIDLYWFGKDIKGHMGNLDWDKSTFPTPTKMLSQLAEKQIKPILVTEPFILSTSSKWQEAVDKKVLAKDEQGNPRRFDFYFGNTGLIDVFDQKAKDWFSDIYTDLDQQGVAGIWGDLGEPEVHPDDSLHYLSDWDLTVRGDEIHNAYGHEWGKMVYENHRKNQPDIRPFMMMRSGFAGSQRYGMIPWTGDVDRSWKGLSPQVELSLQMGLFGLGYTHSDLGGFAGGKTFDKEMYIRWLQYGVFQPIYRPHAQAHIAPEPVFHDEETQSIVREFIKLRYQLLPYNYTLAYENSTTGMPLMRPVFFENENDLNLIDEKHNYFWGDAFLVSPIIKPNETKRSVDLPKGIWFDFWDDTRYQGEKSVEIPVTLNRLPVLVRAGSFVPMIDEINNTQDYSSEKLTLHYYHDKTITKSSDQMFEDDGEDPLSIEQNNFELLKFDFSHSKNIYEFNFSKSKSSYEGAPKTRSVELIVHNWSEAPKALKLSGKVLEASDFNFDQQKNTLSIRLLWAGEKENLVIENNKKVIAGKPVIYQVFTRLFGNKNSTNKPWGTIKENGVGKFNDFTAKALKGIKEFGTTHIWYTGVPHHAVIGDYSNYGISNDDPDIVKGRAGSPYAVKDYYNVNPDLAVDPGKRLEEFKALIQRTHEQGMEVIIDIVPNHIARDYQSLSKPEGVEDFGAMDDVSVEYKRDNNFYYIVGENFKVPKSNDGYQPLNGEEHPLTDNYFKEQPAKWTGNGSRKSQPDINDWYETVKVNYGVKPDGSYDFPVLPKSFAGKPNEVHFDFWKDKSVPNSWKKFKEIVLYWTDLGVDGFRYDMAEMVPVEFWSYLNSAIKNKNPNAILIAEVYNPAIYRDFIALGKMDYLYDKVDFYDTLKAVMQGKSPTSNLVPIIDKFSDIDEYLLHFLENHDEQRIASPDFAGNAEMGKPAMVVSTLTTKAPTMLYFGQAMGEAGEGDAGFGDPTRTTIFDYWGVPSVQRWMNDGKFDGGLLSTSEKKLRQYYVKLLSFSANNSALGGSFTDLHSDNLSLSNEYDESLFSFARTLGRNKLVVVSSFSKDETKTFDLSISEKLISHWNLNDGNYALTNVMSESRNDRNYILVVKDGRGVISASLMPLTSLVLTFNE